MRIVFIGTGAIGVPALRLLRQKHDLVGVVTQPDKPAGREQKMTAPPIKTAIADGGTPVFQPQRIKSEEAIAQIRALAPEVIVVMAYGQILPKAVLEIPRLACLNLHASLLPRWRGAAPIQAAIAAGDGGSGITVIYMDEGLDTGDILLRREIGIPPDETGGSLHDRLALLAPEALADALMLLENGNAPRIPQDNSRATYAPKLERNHGRIDWKEAAGVIERKIRAFNPWPGAFTMIRDARTGREQIFKIFRAAIVTTDHDGLVFRAADGAIAPLEVQLEGSRRMSADQFMRGRRIEISGISKSWP
jgi:methionyl-tRNA formyltransferase